MFNKVYEKIKKFFKEYYKDLIIILILLFVCFYEFPYVVYTPGGLVSLEDRIEVEDGYEYEGSLNMSYVTMRNGTLVNILLSYIIPNWDLLEESEVSGEDSSVDELLVLEKLYMQQSIDDAIITAYNYAGANINITETNLNVIYITDSADTDVQVYDIVKSVEGTQASTVQDLRDVIAEYNPGDTVSIIVERDGEEVECYATIYESDGTMLVGLSFLLTYEYETDPEISVSTKASESGSSGGLMLSLAIYNALVEEDITNGLTIAGTGTIDTEGNVGVIDGIKYKLLGAEKNKADIFLCPVDNYEEALEVKEEYDLDLTIVSVATFEEALEYLNQLNSK